MTGILKCLDMLEKLNNNNKKKKRIYLLNFEAIKAFFYIHDFLKYLEIVLQGLSPGTVPYLETVGLQLWYCTWRLLV